MFELIVYLFTGVVLLTAGVFLVLLTFIISVMFYEDF